MGWWTRTWHLGLWILLGTSIVTVPIVAAQSVREYETWQRQPLGVLDVVYGLLHHDLPPMPDWGCGARSTRLVDGALTVHAYGAGAAVSPYTDTELETLLAARLGVPVHVVPEGSLADIADARPIAIAHPTETILVYHDGYFEGPELHEKIEGFQCDNVAVVNVNGHCVEGIAAHELGHVLGLEHSADGLMRARAAPCEATLDAAQVQAIDSRSVTTEPPLLG